MILPAFFTKILASYFRWLALVIAALILAIGYFGFIAERISAIQTQGFRERTKAEQQLKADQQYVIALQSSASKYEQAFSPAELERINNFIPTTSDFPGLILTLKNIASTSGLRLETITVGQGGAADAKKAGTEAEAQAATTPDTTAETGALALKTQDVSISVSGGTTYDAFKKFIGTIESSQRLFDITSLTFAQPTGGEDKTASTSYSLVLRTYYLGEVK